MVDTENIEIEPSALAGVPGPYRLYESESGKEYIHNNNLENFLESSTHIAWATGRNMVPDNIKKQYYEKGKIYRGKESDK